MPAGSCQRTPRTPAQRPQLLLHSPLPNCSIQLVLFLNLVSSSAKSTALMQLVISYAEEPVAQDSPGALRCLARPVPSLPGILNCAGVWRWTAFARCSLYVISATSIASVHAPDAFQYAYVHLVSSPSDIWLCNLQMIICVLKCFLLLCPKHKTWRVDFLLDSDGIRKINRPCLSLIFPNSYFKKP